MDSMLLARTPAVLESLLGGLPDDWLSRNEGGESWCPLEVVAHLVHAEQTNWMPRVHFLLEFGETRPFPAFARQPAQEQTSLPKLLSEFTRLRADSLAALEALHLAKDLDRRALHPALGTVTLSQLLAAWVTHDLTHLHQLSRVLAYQYRDAVGPWRTYLGVLHCAGHGS